MAKLGSVLRDAMHWAVTIDGAHYGFTNRCHPEQPPHEEDCSGGLTAALWHAGEDWGGCLGSFAQAKICADAGPRISFKEAVWIPGALGFQGSHFGQGGIPGKDHGHVVVMKGDGIHSIECRGHAAGIGEFLASSLFYDGCYFPPGFTRDGIVIPSPIPPIPIPAEEDEDMIEMENTHMTTPGRQATARTIRAFNMVKLDDGARCMGDLPVKDQPHQRWWAPHTGQVPGWQIVGVIRTKPIPAAPYGQMVVRYEFPNGDSGTYATNVVAA